MEFQRYTLILVSTLLTNYLAATTQTIINFTSRETCVRLWHKDRKPQEKMGCWLEFGDLDKGSERCQSTYFCVAPFSNRTVDIRNYCIDKIDVWDYRLPETLTKDIPIAEAFQCKDNLIFIQEIKKDGLIKGHQVFVNEVPQNISFLKVIDPRYRRGFGLLPPILSEIFLKQYFDLIDRLLPLEEVRNPF